jgi:transposase
LFSPARQFLPQILDHVEGRKEKKRVILPILKKVNGRKRHILTDTCGNLINVYVTAANENDRDGLLALLAAMKEHGFNPKKIWADSGYIGTALKDELSKEGYDLEVVKRAAKWQRDPKNSKDLRARFLELVAPSFIKSGFEMLPRRWVVERTFSWFVRFRRLSKDYEYTIRSSTNFILLAVQRIVLKRLHKAIFAI